MNPGAIDATHIILGILGTISLFMVNSVTQAQVNKTSWWEIDLEKFEFEHLVERRQLQRRFSWSKGCKNLDIYRLRFGICSYNRSNMGHGCQLFHRLILHVTIKKHFFHSFVLCCRYESQQLAWCESTSSKRIYICVVFGV